MRTATLVSLALAALTATGCATAGAGAGAKELEKDPRVVVQRAGLATPVVSRFSRAFWVGIGKSGGSAYEHAAGRLATGDAARAAAEATAYLAAHPGDVGMSSILAAALALGGDFERSALYAAQVLAKAPRDADARNLQALGLMMAPKARLPDLTAAERLLKDALRLEPRHIAARLNLGTLYLALGSSAQAKAAFAAAAAQCGDCRPAVIGAGIAAARLGRFADARTAFAKAVEADGKDAEAAFRLAVVYREGFKDDAKAKEVLTAALAAGDAKSGDAKNGDAFRDQARRLLDELAPRAPRELMVNN